MSSPAIALSLGLVAAGLALVIAGAIVLGRRRSHEDGGVHAPANIPYVLLGTGMLWFGWFGFNAGSALSANAVSRMVAAGTITPRSITS